MVEKMGMKRVKVAYIDLTRQQVEIRDLQEEISELYLGGRAVNMYLLYHLLGSGVDPLSPENVLIFGTGVLTGSPALSSARMNITAKSPHSGLLGDSNAGGNFGAHLKWTGIDHIVFMGKSPKPVYLWLDDGNFEFRDASELASLYAPETIDQIKRDLDDPHIEVAAIGPAGRRQVVFANILNSLNNAWGHTGVGAVMGSKNLWAVAVRGTKKMSISDPVRMRELVKETHEQITKRKGFKFNRYYGTLMRLSIMRTAMTLPGRNYQDNCPDLGEDMEPDVFIDNYKIGSRACYNCPQRCKHIHKIKSGPFKGKVGGGPEWAGLRWFSAGIEVDDWDTVLSAWDLCNDYGLDVMTVGPYLGWVYELYQRDFIDEDVTGGLILHWGNGEAAIELIHQMGKKEGFGALLAKGWRMANQELFGELSKEYEYYIPTVKGEPLEGSGFKGIQIAQAIGTATATRGACHLRSRYTLEAFSLPPQVHKKITGREVSSDPNVYEGKAWPTVWAETLCSVADTLGICKFITKWMTPGFLGFEELTALTEAVTGIEMSPEKLWQVGERLTNIERLILLREGITSQDDGLPRKSFEEPILRGPFKGMTMDPDKLRIQILGYYNEHGWDENGIPKAETISQLNMSLERLDLPNLKNDIAR